MTKFTSKELKPGDILAIARRTGGFYLVIYITTNRFEHAFGVFSGHANQTSIDDELKPTASLNPYIQAMHSIKQEGGYWQAIVRISFDYSRVTQKYSMKRTMTTIGTIKK